MSNRIKTAQRCWVSKYDQKNIDSFVKDLNDKKNGKLKNLVSKL